MHLRLPDSGLDGVRTGDGILIDWIAVHSIAQPPVHTGVDRISNSPYGTIANCEMHPTGDH